MVSMGGECAFPPGSTVQFKTALGSTVQGQVVCFDPTLKVLAVKETKGPGGKAVLRMFNMAMISEIREVAEPTANNDSIENFIANFTINTQQVSDRCAHAERRRCVELMEEDVSLDGQKAFVQLRRTLDDVHWKGHDISILERVILRPPYTPESAEVTQATDQAKGALTHVKKILSKPYVAEKRLTSSKNYEGN